MTPVPPALETKFTAAPLAATDEGTFAGYASLFDRVDLGHDRVRRGAFAASLARRGAAAIRMLWQHDPNEPIGIWLSLAEDRAGLFVRGRLAEGAGRARDALALLRQGALDGLSIGFRAARASTDRASGVRDLYEIDLWEISLVTFPMQPEARIVRVEGTPSTASMTREDAPMTATAPQTGPAHAEMMRLFEAYKAANEERLADLERRLSADVLIEDKVARLDGALDQARRRLDELALRAQRPAIGGERAATGPASEHRAAFELYVRSGEASGLKRLEEKALSVGSAVDGGYLVPPETEAEVTRRLSLASPIRSVASVRAVSSMVHSKAFSTSGPATGWVGETDARPETASPPLAQLTFPAAEIYAMPSATQALLEDAAVNIDQWIADEVEQAFAEREGAAFVAGDGVKKPVGFLGTTKVAQSAWSWSKIGYLVTGVAGGFPASNPSDNLVDLVYALKGGYRQNAVWVMNRKLQSALRKFKDSTGTYLWSPPATPGARAMLMNFPIIEAEDMPDMAADSYSIAFGDFRRGYLIVDRQGIRILRDPYSAKPYVLFYTTKRVGGGIQDFDAIKLLKFGTT
jgi:HK97 family phage major capsid protein/HK97 family phage prohead protease